ncbi:hypothetical protein SARC_11926, partial [Sphaeroforma arctica JP610]
NTLHPESRSGAGTDSGSTTDTNNDNHYTNNVTNNTGKAEASGVADNTIGTLRYTDNTNGTHDRYTDFAQNDTRAQTAQPESPDAPEPTQPPNTQPVVRGSAELQTYTHTQPHEIAHTGAQAHTHTDTHAYSRRHRSERKARRRTGRSTHSKQRTDTDTHKQLREGPGGSDGLENGQKGYGGRGVQAVAELRSDPPHTRTQEDARPNTFTHANLNVPTRADVRGDNLYIATLYNPTATRHAHADTGQTERYHSASEEGHSSPLSLSSIELPSPVERVRLVDRENRDRNIRNRDGLNRNDLGYADGRQQATNVLDAGQDLEGARSTITRPSNDRHTPTRTRGTRMLADSPGGSDIFSSGFSTSAPTSRSDYDNMPEHLSRTLRANVQYLNDGEELYCLWMCRGVYTQVLSTDRQLRIWLRDL